MNTLESRSTAGHDGDAGPCRERVAVAGEPEYLNARQLAGKLNVSVKAVIKWTAARRLPACRMGRIWRYPRHEIEKRLISGKLLLDK
jgi:excisionase family DNA binding protein